MSNGQSDDRDDEVGFCKPPKHTQFQKGRSGNPSGRPKGRVNVATVLLKAMHARIAVNEGGRRTQRTKLEVICTQLINKAVTGDLKAIQHVLALANLSETAEGAVGPTADLAASQEHARKILERLALRALQSQDKETDDGQDDQ